MTDSATIASAVSAAPFYRDWTFWSLAVAFVSLAFSIGPLMWRWLRPPKLELDLYDRIALTHKVGNPNLQAHFIVSNTGGREVRVVAVTATVSKDNGPPHTLPARNYLPSVPSAGQTLVFAPFTLKSGDQWAQMVNFIASWGRENEQRYRTLQHELRANIEQKIADRPQDQKPALVVADEAFFTPLLEMYHNNGNRWQVGQYELTVKVTTTSKRIRVERRYRFNLFETDAEELRKLTDDYKAGFGIYLNTMRDPWVYPEIIRL